ncbi:hypothetical protein [uncultured Agrobacterium sp.]|jgi:hypothetical protein|uniref:hypothetical protein n=1 Tax=uncultured Agrobacterium sp. TaxID=157277 RepID=UPI0025EAF93A|nr:hypothetical protein [uncultured Agrobacterium sp.]
MCRISILVAASAVLFSSAQAEERQPFHIARFSDSRTISLTIRSSIRPYDRQYDYDVEIELIEMSPGGQKLYVDHGVHAARVRCEAPAAVKVGRLVNFIPATLGRRSWMQDLWKALCLSPIS